MWYCYGASLKVADTFSFFLLLLQVENRHTSSFMWTSAGIVEYFILFYWCAMLIKGILRQRGLPEISVSKMQHQQKMKSGVCIRCIYWSVYQNNEESVISYKRSFTFLMNIILLIDFNSYHGSCSSEVSVTGIKYNFLHESTCKHLGSSLHASLYIFPLKIFSSRL
jgi:hypothetical protein